MTKSDDYSGTDYWDDYHAVSARKGSNRRNGERIWLTCFLPLLAEYGVRRILDLGCGSGSDALELSRQDFEVTGLDLSQTAIDQARGDAAAENLQAHFEQGDVAAPLSFPDDRFDAVISNLTLHMFREPVARKIVDEVRRCLKPGGLFMFHVNSTTDIPYRLEKQPPTARLGPNFYRLGKGQTMRFFSEQCCRDLVAGWTMLRLEHVENKRADGGVLKCAWRCIALKP